MKIPFIVPKPPRLRFVLREEPCTYKTKESHENPESFAKFFREVVATDEGFEENKEHLVVVLLNSRLKIIGYQVVSVGGLNETSAHPRDIFRSVIVSGCHSFVLMHNHPSGDASPSRADEMVTRRIKEAGELFQIRLVDHIILGDSYYSFREAGFI